MPLNVHAHILVPFISDYPCSVERSRVNNAFDDQFTKKKTIILFCSANKRYIYSGNELDLDIL